MSVDELVAWEVANLPWLAVHVALPVSFALGVLGRVRGTRAYERAALGYRRWRRDRNRVEYPYPPV